MVKGGCMSGGSMALLSSVISLFFFYFTSSDVDARAGTPL